MGTWRANTRVASVPVRSLHNAVWIACMVLCEILASIKVSEKIKTLISLTLAC